MSKDGNGGETPLSEQFSAKCRPEMKEALEEIAWERRIPVAELLRRIVCAEIKMADEVDVDRDDLRAASVVEQHE